MIYLYHIRKTGGRSVIYSFLSMCGDAPKMYRALANNKNNKLEIDNNIFVGWNKKTIEEENFTFAFSHIPSHELMLDKDVFTITILRDPLRRLLSHYRMLRSFIINKINHSCLEVEGEWLGKSFEEFLRRIPKEHLLRQIYMFSKEFNISEAFEKITKCSHYFLLEDFSHGFSSLCEKIGVRLPIFEVNKSSKNEMVDTSYIVEEILVNQFIVNQAKDLLSTEYALYEDIKKNLERSRKRANLLK